MGERSHETVVSDQFGPRAEAYLKSDVHARGEDLDLLARIVGRRPGARALDLGCGGGHASFVLAPLVAKVVAYDLSQAMVGMVRAEAARRGFDNLDTQQGSAERLPCPDASFDLVVSRYSTHHWHDLAAGLAAARSVLKPGGLAVFMDVVAPQSALLDTWLQALELLRDPSHVRNWSVEQWLGLLGTAGFRPGAVSPFRIRLDFSTWVERMNTPEIQVRAIRSLQERAGAEVIRYFQIDTDGSLSLDTMLIAAEA